MNFVPFIISIMNKETKLSIVQFSSFFLSLLAVNKILKSKGDTRPTVMIACTRNFKSYYELEYFCTLKLASH